MALRLFLAIEVPRDAVEAALAAAERYLHLPGARPVGADDAHVTVRFLGWTREEGLPEIESVAGAAARSVPPGTARIRGMGSFPEGRRARVLWAGVEEDGAISALADALAGSLPDPEGRAFHPHLTLARFQPAALLGDLPDGVYGDPFPVARLVLFRSRPGSEMPGRSRYEPLWDHTLGR